MAGWLLPKLRRKKDAVERHLSLPHFTCPSPHPHHLITAHRRAELEHLLVQLGQVEKEAMEWTKPKVGPISSERYNQLNKKQLLYASQAHTTIEAQMQLFTANTDSWPRPDPAPSPDPAPALVSSSSSNSPASTAAAIPSIVCLMDAFDDFLEGVKK